MSVLSHVRIERGLDGAYDSKLNKVPFFALKSLNFNVSMPAALKLALVPANHYYCDVN